MLRAAPDKGQWLLLEVMHRLWTMREQVTLVVLRSPGYRIPARWTGQHDVQQVELPLGREEIATVLRQADVLLDASLHEGFGLLPLEAMACGATVIVSASGGVQDFVKDQENGLVVHEALNPEAYVRAVRLLADNPDMLFRFQASAQQTGALHDAETSYDAYASYMSRAAESPTRVAEPASAELPGEIVFASGESSAYRGLHPGRDVVVVDGPSLLLTSAGIDPGFSLPVGHSSEPSVLRIRLASSVDTTLQVYLPGLRGAGWMPAPLKAVNRSTRGSSVFYREEHSVSHRVNQGWNTLYLRLPPLDAEMVRIDPATAPGQLVISSVEVRQTPHLQAAAGSHALREAFETSRTVLVRVESGDPPDKLLNPTQLEISRVAPCLLSIGKHPQLLLTVPADLTGRAISIEAELVSPRQTLFQMFYGHRGTRAFRPLRSVTRRVTEGQNRLHVVIADSDLDGEFRIDFATGPGEFHLTSLVVRALGASTPLAGLD